MKKSDRTLIAEGRVRYPKEAALLMRKGTHAVVAGSAITRPQFITQSFAEALKGDGN
ncbi:hypothetical protein [Alkalihalobacillus sp. TS-13]|uniref:hypothetical protein n=1 Tax=Alkalihalobacillus sp. TS-13 TaxID=2842455 RepID=UPI001C88A223